MTQYEKYLENCEQISFIYLRQILQYKSQLQDDFELSFQTKEKMKNLLYIFSVRINEFLNVLKAEQELVKNKVKNTHKEIIVEEFLKINKYIDKLFATTGKLQKMKNDLDKQIKEKEIKYVAKHKPKKHMLRVFQERTINDIWYDSVAEEYFRKKQQSIDEPIINRNFHYNKKLMNRSHTVSCSSDFKGIQQEFVTFKNEVKKFKDETHTHKGIERRLQEVGSENLKIKSNNLIVQQEQAELLSQFRKLTDRIQILENENEIMIKKLKRMVGRHS